ncbi:MAG: NAD(P)/FAD-dependent oxidoreductase, partial [Planctomycetes bacterium]|nr:NAD(P)/FAD-dependent oxidoreductase [Planctomycetota bacterium]
MIKCDVCVIGGGGAGLMAGIFAAKAGARTMIIEANPTAGRKLLRTGRGRCNLTHTGSIDDFVRAYGPFGRFVQHSLYEFSPDDVRAFFAEKGLRTKVEKNGCVFPITDRAADVKRILVDTG